MSFGNSGGADNTISGFKKFVSEEELEEKRQKRQEEWEKVRKADDPLEAPEEEYDSRCLFDKLEEQKQKKQDEYEEKHRMSNQVKGLESDEAEFLDFVSQKQQEITKQRENEEQEVLSQYRTAMMNQVTSATSSTDKLKLSKSPGSGAPQGAKKSQMALLAGAVKRKSQDVAPADEKKHKSDDSRTSPGPDSTGGTTVQSDNRPQVAQVIGILPGLGAYDDSSDSDESSSDSDIELTSSNIFPKKIVVQGES